MNKAAKQTLKIFRKLFLGIFLSVYILVALLNLNFVQTTLGHLASVFFSNEWNAEVKIGGISLSIFDHLTIYDVLLKDPSGDTVLKADKIKCSFNGFPIRNGLNIRKAQLKNTYFNLTKDEKGMNLSFLIDYFKSNKPPKKDKKTFPIRVKRLEFDNVNFTLSMPESDTAKIKKNPEGGIDVKNMAFTSIYADIRNILVLNDSIHAQFKRFSTVERTGFTVEQLAMDAIVSHSGIKVQDAHIKTPSTNILFDASLAYSNWSTMKYYIDSVQMKAKIKEGSYANIADGGVWAATSPIFGMNKKVNVELDFEGTVADMRSDFFRISFGKESLVMGKGSMKGLPNMEQTVIDAEITSLTTTVNDINNLNFPKLKLPEILKKMGYVNLRGEFKGKIKDFDASVNLSSQVGKVNAKTKVAFNEKIKDYAYSGDVVLTDFFPATLIENDILSKADLNITFDGQGTSLEKIKAQVEGGCYNFTFQNQFYDSLVFNVTALNEVFNGDIHLKDNHTSIDLEGILNLQNTKVPKCNIKADIQNANLTKFNLLTSRDSNIIFSTKINADLEGKTIDDLMGNVDIENLIYTEGEKSVGVRKLLLFIAELNNQKVIQINSDLLDFKMAGDFRFKDFEVLASRLMSDYVPQFFNRSSVFRPEGIQENQYYTFNLVLYSTKDLCAIFVPSLQIADSTKISGKYNDENGFMLDLTCDSVKINTIKLNAVKMKTGGSDSNFYHINLKLLNMEAGNLTYFDNLDCDINSRSDLLELHLFWDDKKDTSRNNGQINLYAHTEPFIINISFRDSKMLINGDEWKVEQQGLILYSDTDINIGDLIVKTNKQSIEINGEISSDGADELTVDFHQLEIEQFNTLLDQYDFHSSGTIDGKFEILGLKKVPYFKSDLIIKTLVINDEKLGDAAIKATWDNTLERASIDLKTIYKGNKGSSKPISVSGYLYPLREKDNYDLDVAFQNFKLKTIEGFLRSFTSRLEGNLNGQLSVKGKLKAPALKGNLAIDYGKIRVDFLNTIYDFAESIEITEKSIELKNFVLIDSLANRATINGQITHNGFSDFTFNLGMKSKGFMFMNTPKVSNAVYYGSVVADLDAQITGNMEKLKLTATARTARGTSLTIPVSAKANISEKQFINFIEKDTSSKLSIPKYHIKNGGQKKSMEMDINVRLEVTPDAKVNIPLDFNTIKGNLSATGKGNFVVAANTKKIDDLSILGTYTIEKGSFIMTLMDLIDKTFELERGGTLIWTGNPTGAMMNVSAIYPTRASLKSLFANAEDVNNSKYNRAISVQSVIELEGQLMNPDIKFDIRLPYADPTTEDLVFTVIDRNDQNQMLQQTLFLLVNNSFYSDQGGMSAVATTSAVETLGNMLSSLIPYVDLGLSYNAETQATDITVAKDFGKFHVDVNVAGSSSSNNAQSSAQSSLTGNIAYRLNEKVSFYMFNRSNADDITKDNTGYSQGIGVTYQQDFDRIIELFKGKSAEEKAKEKELKDRAKEDKKREKKAEKEAKEKEKAARQEREKQRKEKKKQQNTPSSTKEN